MNSDLLEVTFSKQKYLGNDGVIDEKTTGQVIYDVYGIKEYLHEFERKRYQRISAGDHVQKKNCN